MIVPYGWDQPDNGARIAPQGAGLALPRSAYSAQSAAAALKRLLEEPSFAAGAAKAALQISGEVGVKGACYAIEALLPQVGHATRLLPAD